ncbi:MAG: tyrosine--tRNA ligase [Phycisphaerae bacterium]
MTPAIYDDLEQRGLVHQVSSESLRKALADGRITGYVGFDPSADSLHCGSLLPLMTMARFQRAGHRAIVLAGGCTGLIGDPAGKEDERTMLSRDVLERNLAGIRAQMEQFLNFADPDRGILVNNAEWLGELSLVDFLRDVGKHFSVNQMIVRDSVRMRLETREHGISYTEFTYMLLQAYDYLVLYDRHGCTLQIGGSDQWGNILSGCDLIRRVRGAETHALTIPLMTRADGKKFGKSEEGNIWLDPKRTSPYQFYQFWINTDDRDAVNYLNGFTLLPVERIREIARGVADAPEKREAQRSLAPEVTRMVHGADALARAEHATAVLFDKNADFRELSARQLDEAFRGAPTTALPRARLGTADGHLAAVLAETGLYPSRGRAKKDIPNGAVSVNNTPIRDADYGLTEKDLLDGGFIILRKGKKTYHVLRVADT